jgi:hypothetical protein
MTKKPAPPKRTPRARDLPGMEHRAIAELEEAAAEYADMRDQRMALTKSERELKGRMLGLMHKFKRSAYRRDGLEITVEPGEESIHVKVKKHTEDEDESDAAPDEATP